MDFVNPSDNVEENIDLLGMAPEGEDPVIKMKQYSSDFNAGQIGMILIHANVTGDTNDHCLLYTSDAADE